MASDAPRTFVLVPGGWRGGWAFDPVSERLRRRGHTVHALTLAGLEPEPLVSGPTPNLDTHVDQVVAVVDDCVAPVVLCGHSYGGMVIAAVADRRPERLAGLVYIDAYVPENGDSCWTLTSDRFRDAFATGAQADGRTVAPPSRKEPRARAHPLPSFVQAVRLEGRAATVPPTFVYGGEWAGTPFTALAQRLRADPGWRVHDLPVGHDIMNRAPDELTDVLDSA